MTLTLRQAQTLAFIKTYLQATGGVCPTYAEIGMGIGVASKTSVARLVGQLVDLGFLTRVPRKHQALALTPPQVEPSLQGTFYPCERGVVSRVGRRIAFRRRAA